MWNFRSAGRARLVRVNGRPRFPTIAVRPCRDLFRVGALLVNRAPGHIILCVSERLWKSPISPTGGTPHASATDPRHLTQLASRPLPPCPGAAGIAPRAVRECPDVPQ